MADNSKKDQDKKVTNLRVEGTGDAVIADVNTARPDGPVEITVDPATLPRAENMPSPFASDRSVPNDTLVSDEDREASDKSGEETDANKRKSNLYKEATVWHSENTYSVGGIENEYDTALVDVRTATGLWRDLPLKTKDNASFLNYPYAELGTGKK